MNQQQGVSIYLALAIMTILLAIALGISNILFGQLKVIRGMGDSVIAFYAADSGIEQELYEYIKLEIEKVVGDNYPGFLNLDGDAITPTGDCPDALAQDRGDTCYKVKIISVSPSYTVQSFGVYKEVQRAIEVSF